MSVGSTREPDTLGLPWSAGRLGPLDTLEIGAPGDGRVLVYLHGGGYTGNTAASTAANAALLHRACGLRVVSFDYPTAPGSTYPDTTRLVVEAHRALLASGLDPRQVAYVGDSAGGGLAAGAVLRMLDEGVAPPAALALLSPWTDLSAAGDSRIGLAGHDPGLRWDALALCAAAYARGADPAHPYASPVRGTFGPGFPPTLLQAGTREILLSDAVRLYQAIAGAGGRAVLDVYDGMPHIWMFGEPDLPESVTALARVAEFVHAELGGGSRVDPLPARRGRRTGARYPRLSPGSTKIWPG